MTNTNRNAATNHRSGRRASTSRGGKTQTRHSHGTSYLQQQHPHRTRVRQDRQFTTNLEPIGGAEMISEGGNSQRSSNRPALATDRMSRMDQLLDDSDDEEDECFTYDPFSAS
jgi:hypothetical protein